RAGESDVIFLNRRGLQQIERFALRHSLDDVDHNDVGELLECDALRNRGADIASADNCHFCFHELTSRARGFYPMLSDFTAVANAIGATTKKLEKERLLSDYLRPLDDATLERAVVFFSGSPFPQREERVTGVGGAAISDAVSEVTGRS